MSLDVASYLRPGDTVLVGQGGAEPTALVARLIAAARSVDDLTAVCGYTLGPAWSDVVPGTLTVKAAVVHGAMRRLPPGVLDVLPVHASRMADHIGAGRLPVDVVLLQVGPPDDDGHFDLGLTVDHAVVAARRARVVLVEVNENMPRTRSAHRLHRSRVTAAAPSSRPLVNAPDRPATGTEARVAANVAPLVPDGAVLQLGLGGLAAAVAKELRSHRRLRVRSGLAGDWLLDLHEAGALDDHPGSVMIGIALGSDKLYAFLDGGDVVEFAPVEDQTGPAAAEFSPFVSVNSAVEVDLLGQANAELAGGRYVGAVGGQVDFFRAAHRSAGGLAIAALTSVTPSGRSRIVTGVEAGVVTALKSDVDVVVTEWGVADLRACSVRERAARLVAVAHPDHRAALAEHRPGWPC